ncbi:MAG: OmpA family protein [Sandaracinaceae bacterium]
MLDPRAMLRSSAALGYLALSAACGSPPRGAEDAPTASAARDATEPAEPCACTWVHLPMRIEFAPRSAEVPDAYAEVLQIIVTTTLERDDLTELRVEGHSSTCPEEMHDQALSEARARAVAARLVALGLDEAFVSTIGYASTMPNKRGKEVPDVCNPAAIAAGALSHERRVELSALRCTRGEGRDAPGCAEGS